MDESNRRFAFGPFLFDLSARRLTRGATEIPLTPKAFATLRVLVERCGQAVSKEELLTAVWPDIAVEENNLTQNISLLRRVLDSGDGKEYIATVPRHGYRFVASVAEVDPKGGATPADPSGFTPPETRYTRSGGVNIAYQVLGDGPIDLVFVMGWLSHLEYFWMEPSFARFLRRLASFSRLILFDKRGTGLSDRVPLSELPTLEQRMEDVHAVLEAAGSKRAALCGVSEGGPMSALFAATYPEMTSALIMIGTYARRLRGPGYPWGLTEEEHHRFLDEIENRWGGPVGLLQRAPSMAADTAFRKWWATYLRMAASPSAALAVTKMNAEIDVRNILPTVRVPTLVLHRTRDLCLNVEEGRFVASLIPGAQFIELPGLDHLPFVGDQEEILGEIERFLATLEGQREYDRELATVVLVTLPGAGSTPPEAKLVSELCHQAVSLGGRVFNLSGFAAAASFQGPARALRTACAILETAQNWGVQAGVGLHTGECDRLTAGAMAGPAVEIAAQVARRAAGGQVLVSSTVRDLVAGSPFRFDFHGELALSPELGDWRVFRLCVPSGRAMATATDRP